MDDKTMVTIKQYAEKRGVSYESVRRQVVRYAADLEGHITKQNKLQFLDEYAVRFLDRHRLPRTVIQEPSDDDIRAEMDSLRAEIDRLRNEIVHHKDMIIQLQEEKSVFIEQKTRAETLLEVKDAETATLKTQIEEITRERDTIRDDLSQFTPTWFGLYKKNPK